MSLMNLQTIISHQAFLSWLFGGLATFAAGGWAVFTYFDGRRVRDKPGVPPEEVVQMFRSLLLQSKADQVDSERSTIERPDQRALELRRLSKFLALVLRHKPDAAGLIMDSSGWADVGTLIAGLHAAGYKLKQSDLDDVVRTSLGKQNEPRFAFSDDKRRIRANWGRSIQSVQKS
jgi:hypothetical protein